MVLRRTLNLGRTLWPVATAPGSDLAQRNVSRSAFFLLDVAANLQ